MAYQTHGNFAYGTVATAPSPATTGTTIVLGTTTFADFPTPTNAYSCTIWPAGTIPLSSNAEIITLSSKGTNGTIGVARAAESSSARTVVVGDQFAMTITSKALTDIETVAATLAGTETLTNKTIASHLAYADTRFKVGSFSRTINAADGNVAYTGVGFAPKAILFFGGVSGGAIWEISCTDATGKAFMFHTASGSQTNSSDNVIYFGDGANWNEAASAITFDSDGFTLTWAKGGSPPASTANVLYLAFR